MYNKLFSQRSTITKGLIVFYLFSVVYAILTQRTFYADGAHYFLKLLEEKSFIYGDDFARHYAHYFTQFPIVILIRLFDVRDVNVLSFAFGFGLYFPQLISLWLCYSIAKTKNVYFTLFPVIALFAIDMNLSFMSVHESHVIANIFWPILFYLVLKENLSWKDSLVMLLLGLVFTRSYESASILGIMLLAILIYMARKRWEQASHVTKASWVLMGILFVISISIAVHSIVFPRCPGNKAAFLSSFPAILEHLPALLSFVYISVISACIFFPKFSASVFYKVILILLVAATIFISITPFTMPELVKPYLQYPARVYMTYMLPLLSVVAFFVLKGIIVVPEATWKRIAVLVAFLVIGQTTWQILATRQWDGFRQIFKKELTTHEGIVPYENTVLKEKRIGNQIVGTMDWEWINPTLSILWSKDQDVTTIILNPANYAGGWQPFDPLDMNSIPKVEDFGFSFNFSAML